MNVAPSQDVAGQHIILDLLSAGLWGTVAQLVVLSRQVFGIEGRIQSKTKTPCSPFNLQLMAMSVFLLVVHVCYIIQVEYGHNTNFSWIRTIFIDFFAATFEFAYVRYSWTRTSTIIARRIDSVTLRIITVFVNYCPFIRCAPTEPALLDATAAYHSIVTPYIATLNLIGAGVERLGRSLHVVLRFGETTARGQVIVKNGAGGCCIWICVVLEYAGSTLLEEFSFQYHLMAVFLYWGSLGTFFALYCMKVAL
ncbi:hypothetical protein BC830DRAFT_1165039 [Chytriomyces sp. MP71]|nr:hypothetical protein BC830DRAFT_1165039 [Chytriomyces sp. MP71]